MVEDNKKFITVSFVLSGILGAFVLRLLFELLAGYFAFFSRLQNTTAVANGVPVAVGLLIFALLQFNPKVVGFADGVVGELKKVVWPSRRDTGLMTVVVVITLIISGIALGIIDSIWAFIVNYFVK